MPKFSIIIPTYNKKDLLREQSLKSLLNQTLKDFEVIVVNDGGEDVSDVIEEYKNKGLNIKYLTYKENKGPSYARNRGIEIAEGEWIGFLDDDDEYLEDALEVFNKHLFNDEHKIKCAIGQAIKKIYDQEIILPPDKEVKLVNRKKALYWILKWWLTPGNWIVEKIFLRRLGGFDENISVGEDLEFGLRIFSNVDFREECVIIPQPVYIHYLKNIFDKNLNRLEKGIKDYFYILEKHKEKLKENKCLNYFYYRIGTLYEGAGYRKEAVKYFILSFTYFPLQSLIRILMLFLPISLILNLESLFLKLKIKFVK